MKISYIFNTVAIEDLRMLAAGTSVPMILTGIRKMWSGVTVWVTFIRLNCWLVYHLPTKQSDSYGKYHSGNCTMHENAITMYDRGSLGIIKLCHAIGSNLSPEEMGCLFDLSRGSMPWRKLIEIKSYTQIPQSLVGPWGCHGMSWWYQGMETCSTSLALCKGNPQVKIIHCGWF